MRNVGMTSDKLNYGPDGIFEEALVEAAGKDAEGLCHLEAYPKS